MHIGVGDIVVLALAAYIVTYVALDASIPVVALPREALRRAFEKRRDDRLARMAETDRGRLRNKTAAIGWGSLLTLSQCSWCFGAWAALGMTAYVSLWVASIPGEEFPIVWGAVWALVGTIATAVDDLGIWADNNREDGH